MREWTLFFNVLSRRRCLLLALFCIGVVCSFASALFIVGNVRIDVVFASGSIVGDGIVSEGCILVDRRCFIWWMGVGIIF